MAFLALAISREKWEAGLCEERGLSRYHDRLRRALARMPLLVFVARKLSRAKWVPENGIAEDEIPADAVTVDLRTLNNAISFWKCAQAEEDDVDRVILALAAVGERIDKVDVVWLERRILEDDGIKIVDSNGQTPVASMVREHVDATCLDMHRLGNVASRIAEALRAKQTRRLTRARVRKLLAMAVQEGLVELNAFKANVEQEVRKAL